MNKLFSSPQTSATGIANIILGIWLMYNGHQTEAMVALTAGLQGLFARDNKTTSEQAGAKPNDPEIVVKLEDGTAGAVAK